MLKTCGDNGCQWNTKEISHSEENKRKTRADLKLDGTTQSECMSDVVPLIVELGGYG